MNKIFLRILLGLVATFIALGLFSTLVLSIINSVRGEHYWHDLITPYFEDLVAAEFHKNNLMHYEDTKVLPSGMTFQIYDEDKATYTEDRRLKAGQVVVNLNEAFITGKVLVSLLTPDNVQEVVDKPVNYILQLQSEPGGEQVYEFIAWYYTNTLVQLRSINRNDKQAFNASIGALALLFDVDLFKLDSHLPNDSEYLLEVLAEKNWAKVQEENSARLYIRLPSGEIYSISLPAPFSMISIPVILFLGICAIIAIALLAYGFVQGFDKRIRSIETAASRIARGELDARVTSAGEEDAISRLGLSFNSMADHIQRLMYVQKEMIHAVSHELRTPVARIRFGVQMIEDCQTPESVQKQVKGIDGDIQELDELIDEILTYARLEQGGPILAFQQADVAAIVEQVISEQSTGKPGIKIFSEYKDGSSIWKESEIETRYIHRSIQNLVGNAKRYADSKVKVVCSFDAETCRIDVEDDGPGIPEDQWESVFTPFARLDDSRTRSSGGYGLGLSIVRRILYWHGGQAFLGRSEMGGAKFSLVWPRKQAS